MHRRETGVPTQLASSRGNPRVSGPRPRSPLLSPPWCVPSVTARTSRPLSGHPSLWSPPARTWEQQQQQQNWGRPERVSSHGGSARLPETRREQERTGRSGDRLARGLSAQRPLRVRRGGAPGSQQPRLRRAPGSGLGPGSGCVCAGQSEQGCRPEGNHVGFSALGVPAPGGSSLGSLRASHTAQILFDVIK